jgi:hypothetical protein
MPWALTETVNITLYSTENIVLQNVKTTEGIKAKDFGFTQKPVVVFNL